MRTLSWRLLCHTPSLICTWTPIGFFPAWCSFIHHSSLGDACNPENAPSFVVSRRLTFERLVRSHTLCLSSPPSGSSSLPFDSWVIQARKMAGAHSWPEESIHYFCSQKPVPALLPSLLVLVFCPIFWCYEELHIHPVNSYKITHF